MALSRSPNHHEGRGRWRAAIKSRGKTYHLGRYDDERKAALAYDEKAIELLGERAKTNILPPVS